MLTYYSIKMFQTFVYTKYHRTASVFSLGTFCVEAATQHFLPLRNIECPLRDIDFRYATSRY